MSKLDISVLIGHESKQFLAQLSQVVERLEKVAGTASLKNQTPTTPQDTDEDDAPETKKRTKQTAKADEEQFDLGAADEPEEEAHVISIKEVIAACKADRENAIKALKKLKVSSVHELKPAQYPKLLAEIGA